MNDRMTLLLLLFVLAPVVYLTGKGLYVVLGSVREGARVGRHAEGVLLAEVGQLPVEALRSRLLQDEYLLSLANDARVKAFLAGIAAGDEAVLAREYPRGKLYDLLAGAELNAGLGGRPEAVDAVGEIAAVLQELASRRANGAGGRTRG